jgi:hypothetical protein
MKLETESLLEKLKHTHVPLKATGGLLGVSEMTVFRYLRSGIMLRNGRRIWLASAKVFGRTLVPLSGEFPDWRYGIADLIEQQLAGK